MISQAAKSFYAGYRFPPEVISHTVWLYFRFPLSLRMVEEMLAARGIIVSHESVRQWALKFGQDFANRIRRLLPAAGDKWHLDEVAIKIAGQKRWLWRAQHLRKEWDHIYRYRSNIFHGILKQRSNEIGQRVMDAQTLCGRIVLAYTQSKGVRIASIAAIRF